jgi:hypothetical protein
MLPAMPKKNPVQIPVPKSATVKRELRILNILI